MVEQFKINLHCHSVFSDGAEDLSALAVEHKNRQFSAFVITDHVYPSEFNLPKYRYIDWKSFLIQRRALKSISRYFNFPCFQGIELAIGLEEVLVFGLPTIQKIFDYLESNKYSTNTGNDLLKIVVEDKDNNAAILCHPCLDHDLSSNHYKLIFNAIDGYEKENHGCDFFSNEWREIPEQLKNKNQFFNSDAHFLPEIDKCKNLFERIPEDEQDLVKMIKKGIMVV